LELNFKGVIKTAMMDWHLGVAHEKN